jgi:hypothetical protein
VTDLKKLDPDEQQRMNLIVLVVAVVIVALSVFLLLELRSGTATLDCEMAHHRNCVPVDDQIQR